MCGDTAYQCHSGRPSCISPDRLCDGNNHCANGTDEEMCGEITCNIFNNNHVALTKTILGKCGGEHKSNYGVITSPSYPKNYAFDANCEYSISGDENTYIDLSIQIFNLYDRGHYRCRGFTTYDYVEIRDGDSEASPLIAKLCGGDKPTPIHSTQNKLWIR